MPRVIANLSMSVDGFIADPDDGVRELFGWFADGPVAVEDFAGRTFRMTETSAALFRDALASTGAFLVGRRLYDHTNGWDARPPVDAPMVVVTHDPPDDWPRGGASRAVPCGSRTPTSPRPPASPTCATGYGDSRNCHACGPRRRPPATTGAWPRTRVCGTLLRPGAQ